MDNKLMEKMPARWKKPSLITVGAWLIFLAFFLQGLYAGQINLGRLIDGVSNLGRFFAQAIPPDLERLLPASEAMLETFNIGIVGTTFGVIFSLPISLLAADNTSPNYIIRTITRGVIALLRTVPDLIWAIIFVISVGLGPLPGILAITVDTIGLCSRFFSERIEELKVGPIEALESTGASKISVILGSVIPAAFPSFVGTSLYAVEKSIRSAVVLGIVGAGGIGVELSTSMTLMRYDEAFTIILLILIVVIAVQKISQGIRKKII